MTTDTLPPGPASRFLPGRQLLAFRRTPDSFLRLARRYGDVVHLKIGPQRFFLLSHPDHVKGVLLTHHQNFRRGWGPQQGNTVLGEGVVTSEGERHQRQRRLVLPAFHKERISAYARVMVDLGQRHCQAWGDGQTLDLEREMRTLTLAVVGRVLFGARVDAVAEELAGTMADVMQAFGTLMVPYAGPLKRLLLPRKHGRLRAASRRLDETIFRIIEERRQAAGHDDLLSLLMQAEAEPPEGRLSDRELRDEVMTFLLAGHEAMTNTLSWTWYLLSRHPEVEAALHAEVDGTLAGRAPTMEDVPSLRYTAMVFSETLRLYPAQWMIGRKAIADYDVGGYRVPAGSFVLVSPYVLHHDPRYYADPFRFDPMRWTEDARQARPPFAYFPFGGGARRCIGEGFAWAEGVLLLAVMASAWRLRLAGDRAVEPQPLLTLRPKNGMWMRVERRQRPG